MFIERGNKYIIPVKYVSGKEVDLPGFDFVKIDNDNISPDIKEKLKSKINYLYFKLKDLISYVQEEYHYKIYESLYKSILFAHVNNVPCFAVIKEKNINGMSGQEILEIELAKFKRIYELHRKGFEGYDYQRRSGELLGSDDLEVKLEGLKYEINCMFKQIRVTVSNLTGEEVLAIHIFMMKIVMELLANNIMCFSEVKNGFNGMSFAEIQKIHETKFVEIYYSYVNLFKCK